MRRRHKDRRRVLALGLVLPLGAAVLASGRAHAAACGPRADIVAALRQRHGERPASIAMTTDGRVIELWRREEGPWTLLITTPQGRSCVVAAGRDVWETLPEGAPV